LINCFRILTKKRIIAGHARLTRRKNGKKGGRKRLAGKLVSPRTEEKLTRYNKNWKKIKRGVCKTGGA
jgi:hypothetical protein